MQSLLTNFLLLLLLSGLVLTHWPMVMNLSGLSGIMSAAIFSTICSLGLIVVAAFSDKSSLYTADWKYAIGAGLLGSLGLAILGYVIANASAEQMSNGMVPFLLIQIVPPLVYNSWQSGHVSGNKIITVIAIGAAIFFNSRD